MRRFRIGHAGFKARRRWCNPHELKSCYAYLNRALLADHAIAARKKEFEGAPNVVHHNRSGEAALIEEIRHTRGSWEGGWNVPRERCHL